MSQEPETTDQLNTDFDSFFEDQSASPAADGISPRELPSLTSRMSVKSNGNGNGQQPLYLDIETVPDDDRTHLFDLPPIAELPPEREIADCPPPTDLLGKSIEVIGEQLLSMNPCHQYLNMLAQIEGDKPKPRDGVRKAIAAVHENRRRISGAGDQQRKDMATNPAMCRIVSIAAAIGQGDIVCHVVGEWSDRNEVDLLEWFWELANACAPFVTWNGNNFDLRVILFRSILLGVNPTRTIDLSRYRQDSLDLQEVFYRGQVPPKGRGQKWVAKVLGIPIPADGVDGSQVEAMWREGRHAELAEYNKSDVWCLRELHGKLSGTFVI
jgi:hypothetical protein